MTRERKAERRLEYPKSKNQKSGGGKVSAGLNREEKGANRQRNRITVKEKLNEQKEGWGMVKRTAQEMQQPAQAVKRQGGDDHRNWDSSLMPKDCPLQAIGKRKVLWGKGRTSYKKNACYQVLER